MTRFILPFIIILGFTASCSGGDKSPKMQSMDYDTQTIAIDELRDKIAGGWAGKMIGVTWGEKSEFRALGETYEEPLPWEPSMIAWALRQDDIYVQMSFMMTMDEYGIDAPTEKFAESFATAGYRLWHANVQARKNFFDGIMPPESGSPEYNLHADDIDFQIEADYIGFMCPAMPAAANHIANRIGRIMNYGDGVYGGMFVAALYAEAFFNDDVADVVDKGLLSIPRESDYAKCVRDVIRLHSHYPDDWRAAWRELEDKWGSVDICGALQPFNIDAKLNGAYIVMGLLYGNGDFEKTMEVSIRCGQDSDCNPSNAAAVIGVMNGLSGIPDKWTSGIPDIADSTIIFTDYTFNSAVDNTLKYALDLIRDNSGEVTATEAKIRVQLPYAPEHKDAFPDLVPDYISSPFNNEDWQFSDGWETLTHQDKPYAIETASAGSEAIFTFEGTGICIRGDWVKDGGMADVYLDGKLHRTVSAHYFWAGEEKHNEHLWHAIGLKPGSHTVRIVVTGDKKPDSEGTRIVIRSATVFKTGKKTNESHKFSFEM